MQLPSYPKLWAIGTRHVLSILEDDVVIQEKIDGSQFTWMNLNGELFCRSKGKQLVIQAPEKMFARAVEYLQSIIDRIPENVIFRGEWLDKPKHNVLAYDRTPKNGLMLFDAEFLDLESRFADRAQLEELARIMDIECVPFLFEGKIESSSGFLDLLDRISILGGQKIEGVVVKNYHKPYMLADQYQPFMAGKFVSEKFKEVAANTWGKEHTSKGGFDAFRESFATEARFHKAIQHLKEAGMLDNSPKDIGPLIKEMQRDITEEEKENIKDRLWGLFGKDILRTAVRGVPEKYKEYLVQESF